jgi:hypothetical protein
VAARPSQNDASADQIESPAGERAITRPLSRYAAPSSEEVDMHVPALALVLLLGPTDAPPRVSVSLSFVEPSGRTVAEKTVDAILGSETPAEVKDRNRTITVKTKVQVAAKPDCYLANIEVRDQDIDPSGHFSRKEWKTGGEVCTGFTITLGPRDETRVRLGVSKKK